MSDKGSSGSIGGGGNEMEFSTMNGLDTNSTTGSRGSLQENKNPALHKTVISVSGDC